VIESSTPYWPDDLPLPLVGGSRDDQPKAALTTMETGRIRKRRMFDQQLKTLQVQWNFTEDQFSTFKSFYEDDLENGSLSFATELFHDESDGFREVAFTEDQYTFSRSDNLFTVDAELQIVQEGWPYWSYANCQPPAFTNGGGDNFDCYPAGTLDDLLFQSGYHLLELIGGTGFSGGWLYGDNEFNNVYGDTFETYSVGAAGTMEDGTGFSEGWKYS
jgi:hypothetical protein